MSAQNQEANKSESFHQEGVSSFFFLSSIKLSKIIGNRSSNLRNATKKPSNKNGPMVPIVPEFITKMLHLAFESGATIATAKFPEIIMPITR